MLNLFKRRRFYAEFQTDKFLRDNFVAHVENGVMVEVGAAGPQYLSMSRHFRESGWRVVAIEPNPHFIKQHMAEGLRVLPYACGEHDEDGVDFELVLQPVALHGGQISYESFSSLKVTDEYRKLNPAIRPEKIKVNMRRLDTLLAQELIERVDLLSIDVEGWELQVLNGFALERFAPIVVMENLLGDAGYVSYMADRGYRLHSALAHNQVFVPTPS